MKILAEVVLVIVLVWAAMLLLMGCAVDPNGSGPCNNMLLDATVCIMWEPTGVPDGYPRDRYVIEPPAPPVYVFPYANGYRVQGLQ